MSHRSSATKTRDDVLTLAALAARALRALAAKRTNGARPPSESSSSNSSPSFVVALALKPSVEALALLIAIASANAIAMPMNPKSPFAERARASASVGARVVVVDDDDDASFDDMSATIRCACEGEIAIEIARAHSLFASQRAPSEEEKEACAEAFARASAETFSYVHTSGTSNGMSKIVELTYENVNAASRAKGRVIQYDASDVFAHFAPLFHVGGLSSAHAAFIAGAKHVFIRDFDADRVLEVIASEGVTAFIAVPTMMTMVLRAAKRSSNAALPTVRKILIGGGRLLEPLRGVCEIFPNASVIMAYGMTEASSSVTFMRADDERLAEDATFAGEPAPEMEIKTDQDGQILIRGAQLMRGYLGVDRASTFDADGWFATGDSGRVVADADGATRCWLVGRVKEMIKSGGENVAPQEVEGALSAYENVESVVVVGVPHALWGEAVTAIVRLKEPTMDVDAEVRALKAHCAASIDRFKVPKAFIFIEDDIPRNTSGKVMRAAVREKYLDAILDRLSDA